MLIFFKFRFIFLVFLTKILFVKLENSNFREKVIGGYESEDDRLAKYIVSIRRNEYVRKYGSNHICAGSIIQDSIILTAAHCVMFNHSHVMEPSALVVFAGDPIRTTRHNYVQERYVKRILVHPEYDIIYKKAELALIFLTDNLSEDDHRVQRVQLIDRHPSKGWMCTTFGWGQIYPDSPNGENGPLADKIRYVNLTISDEPTYIIGTLGRANLSIGDPGRGSCTGDVGNPLLCNGGLLTGLSSYHLGYCGYKTEFTNLYLYRKWILGDYKKDFDDKNSSGSTQETTFISLAALVFIFK